MTAGSWSKKVAGSTQGGWVVEYAFEQYGVVGIGLIKSNIKGLAAADCHDMLLQLVFRLQPRSKRCRHFAGRCRLGGWIGLVTVDGRTAYSSLTGYSLHQPYTMIAKGYKRFPHWGR